MTGKKHIITLLDDPTYLPRMYALARILGEDPFTCACRYIDWTQYDAGISDVDIKLTKEFLSRLWAEWEGGKTR